MGWGVKRTFGLVHIHRAHVSEFDKASRGKTFDGKGAKGTIVSTSTDDYWCGDGWRRTKKLSSKLLQYL